MPARRPRLALRSNTKPLSHVTRTPATFAEPVADRSHGRTRYRLGAILAAHTAVDVYAAFLAPILLVLSLRAGLDEVQAAWLLGIGSLASGLSQPLSAWLTDHMDSRVFGPLGLALAAVCLSGIGVANSFLSLAVLFAIGMLGVGVFHPVGAASMGQIAESGLNGRRSLGVSLFFVAGMAGGVSGSVIAPRLTGMEHGFVLLALLMVPGLVIAGMLHAAIRDVPHRHHDHHTIRFDRREIRLRWAMVVLLWLGNAMRFTVNMALIYLVVRWTRTVIAEAHPELTEKAIVDAAAPLGGNLLAAMIVGMALGGLTAGTLIRHGREKLPLIIVPVLFAPAVALFPLSSVVQAYALAILAGIGFASMVPVTIGLAQRLLPHRTGLASGLMLGGAWWIALLGPRLAEYCLGTAGLSLKQTFALTAGLLALSGVVALPLRSHILARSASHNRAD